MHEIHVEDIQRVDPKERQDSRRLTRQKSRTINEQVSYEGKTKNAVGPKKNVKFGGDDSLDITQNTPEDQSEVGEPLGPGMQTSLMQVPGGSAFTRMTPDRGGSTGDAASRMLRANVQQHPYLRGNLQQSTNTADALKSFSNYPQMSALRPMDGNYQGLNK